MKSFAILALVGAAIATPFPGGVTSAISPKSTAPAGCEASYPGTFEISVVNVTKSKRSVEKRQDTALVISLANGVLTDAKGRTGYIASNYQFQFDGPPQAGAIYTAGWSACSNGSLALGGSTIFYQCLSGTFYNLYDESTGAQCSPVYIDIVGGGATVSSQADGQPTAASASAVATEKTDGQVTATPISSVACEYTDGQPQVNTCTAAAVSEYTDGQPQVTGTVTYGAVSEKTDGQPQVTGTVVSEYTDGQPQAATTAAPVTQISDGQIQAPTSTSAVVTQISDGQPQAPTNGSTVASATATVQPFTGAAALPTVRSELFGLAAGLLALIAL